MSAEFPTLAEVITRTLTECGVDDADMVETPDIVRAWSEACTIRTVEQIDALPEQSVVRNMAFGVVFECEVENDGSVIWASPGGLRVTTVVLPALLVWHPDWAKS